jgi:hypothetical protein
MSILNQVKTGPRRVPPRLVIYGPGGVGKTTWAAKSPAPLLLPTEDGQGVLDIPALPRATSYTDHVHAALMAVLNDEHNFRTLIVDSLDHLEPLIWADTCKLGGKASIEDFGYGKGYVEALGFWRQFYGLLDAIRERRGMAVILIAHHEVKAYQDPSQEGYDRYQIKLHKGAAALAQEWADAVLFATYRVHAVEVGGKTKGMGTGERVLLTEERPSHVAKNRWGLPYELPLEFAAFAAAHSTAMKPKTTTTTTEADAQKETP